MKRTRKMMALLAGLIVTNSLNSQNITGASTQNYVLKFTNTSATAPTAGNSLIFDDGTNVSVGFSSAGSYKLDVNGNLNAGGHSNLTTQGYYLGNNRILWHNGQPNNIFVGKLAGGSNTGGGSFGGNTAVGSQALQMGSGDANTAVGYNAFAAGTTAQFCTAIGCYAFGSGVTTGNNNTGVGYQALYSNTGGTQNTAVGTAALGSNLTGSSNCALGSSALGSVTTGSYNVAVGYTALQDNTANYNTAVGGVALSNNTTGVQNSALGYGSLTTNVTGSYNTSVGYAALTSNTAGNNTAVGSSALTSNTTGSFNTALGTAALELNSTGQYNTAAGYQALLLSTASNNSAFGNAALDANTSGAANDAFGSNALTTNTTGNNNAAFGMKALELNSTGNGNVAAGFACLDKNTTSWNSGLGYEALFNTTTGSNNVGVGTSAGLSNTTGSSNVFIGQGADANAGNYTNSIAIGQGASITASNYAVIGNLLTTSIGGYASWTNYSSDIRIKKDVNENVPGLAFINRLRPVTYHYDLPAMANILGIPDSVKATLPTASKNNILYSGFVTQEVEQAAQAVNYNFSGIHAPQNNGLHGLRYAEFVMPLVKSVQELSKLVDSLQTQLNSLKPVSVRKSNNNTLTGNENTIDVVLMNNSNQPLLEGAVPNPLSEQTTIGFVIPENTGDAQITFFDSEGKIIRSVYIKSKGRGQLNVSTVELVKGTYTYTLIIDGKVIDTKKMIKQ